MTGILARVSHLAQKKPGAKKVVIKFELKWVEQDVGVLTAIEDVLRHYGIEYEVDLE